MMPFDPPLSVQHVLELCDAAPFPAKEIKIALVGSMYIHGAGEDYDYVVLVPNAVRAQADYIDWDYSYTGQDSGAADDFITLRKGVVNVILTESLEFYENFIRAAKVCKYVQRLMAGVSDSRTLTKEERIALHRIIMNEEEA